MRVLIVCSFNNNRVSAFIEEQVHSLNRIHIETEYFLIKQKGIKGYISERRKLMRSIRQFKPDIIHAYYGLSGLLANLQRKIPVITTYLGSDINFNKVFVFSRLCQLLSEYNIFVSEFNRQKSGCTKHTSVIPFGVETSQFLPIDKILARKTLGINEEAKIALFAGSFNNPVKNPDLAKYAIEKLTDLVLMPMGGYPREIVPMLYNAADVCLMTSFTEGSPQFIKEAMACNCPIVSVPVGDVPEVISGIDGCFLSTYVADNISEKLKSALAYGKRTTARQYIIEQGWDTTIVAGKIAVIYHEILQNKHSK